MSTTIIPNIDSPLKDDVNLPELYKFVKDWFKFAQANSDKAGEMDNAYFYEGQCNVLENIFNMLCTDPDPDFLNRKTT